MQFFMNNGVLFTFYFYKVFHEGKVYVFGGQGGVDY